MVAKKQDKENGKGQKELMKHDDKPGNPKEGEFRKMYDELKEIYKNPTKPLEIKQKDMQEVMNKIDEKNKAIMKELNKEINIKNDEITRLMAEYKKAQEANDKSLQNRIMTQVRKQQEEIAQVNIQKKATPNPDRMLELLKGEDKEAKNRYFNFDPKSKIF